MSKSRRHEIKDDIVLEMAGLCKLPRNLKRKYGYSTAELPTESRNLHIYMKSTDYEQLRRPEFLEYQAKKIFTWMQENLPHGIYKRLLNLMIEHKEKLDKLRN